MARLLSWTAYGARSLARAVANDRYPGRQVSLVARVRPTASPTGVPPFHAPSTPLLNAIYLYKPPRESRKPYWVRPSGQQFRQSTTWRPLQGLARTGHNQTMHFGARTSVIVCMADRRRAGRSGIAPSRRQTHASGRTVAHESGGSIVSEWKGTGLTFGRWRQQMRPMGSITLVLQGAPITQVERSSGYESQSAHAVAFKKHFGISASGFWRSVKRLES
ncbi:hypothetical protein C7402_102229 [Paraburkholderia unamae]|uniref:HTH araC/xylS-type domain-containing protein n=1 Tax=Paraburkholderia unamae TaxID=219649 RepID=A0ABX5KTG6_9BURK|nr:hypothetical protein C7402_102229 [Paraburkholderia unamae]